MTVVPRILRRLSIGMAAIVLLGGYLVAGFVTPGFLGAAASAGGSHPADVKAMLTRLAKAAETRDRGAFADVLCPTAQDVDLYLYRLGDVDRVTISRAKGDAGGTLYFFTFVVARQGEAAEPWDGILRKQDGAWCLSTFSGQD